LLEGPPRTTLELPGQMKRAPHKFGTVLLIVKSAEEALSYLRG
jgi:hypothetical protein